MRFTVSHTLGTKEAKTWKAHDLITWIRYEWGSKLGNLLPEETVVKRTSKPPFKETHTLEGYLISRKQGEKILAMLSNKRGEVKKILEADWEI